MGTIFLEKHTSFTFRAVIKTMPPESMFTPMTDSAICKGDVIRYTSLNPLGPK
jgi:hypothetical protein